jgi:glutathione reductase (NADPH)
MVDRRYDLVVVGTGVASAVASRCRAAGWSVAVVDSRPFGGTCALRGCNPKKVLVSAAEAVHAARNMAGRGVRARELTIDWSELMQFKRTFTDPVPERTEQGWRKAGVDLFHGRARFVGPTTLAVKDDRLVGRRVLIAAGSMPAPMRFTGSEHLTTSEQFLDLDTLPPRLVFVGGGYISFELAHVAARAGAQVIILHRGPRPLEGFDPDLVDLLVKRTREVGIRVEVATEVQGIDDGNGQLTVRGVARGEERRFDTDAVVHGAGRVPEIDDLDLDAAGIKREGRGVTVNDYLQSVSNPSVYAAGDAAAAGPPLTPKATHDAEVVSTNLLEGNKRRVDYDGIATVVFTIPPLAATGLTEDAARAKGRHYRVRWQDTSQWFNSRRLGESASGFKVLVEEGTRRILGAHLLGPQADVVINLFAVAIRAGIPADDLKAVLFAYPTVAADIPYMLS